MHLAREDFDDDVPRDLAPRERDIVRLYGSGIDSEIHGVHLNGRRLYYREPAERLERRRQHQADSRLSDQQRSERRRRHHDATVEALSAPLRARLERLRQHPRFREEQEAAVLAACVDADRIAALLRRGWADDRILSEEEAVRAVQGFRVLDWSEQKLLIPELHDAHSVNSLDVACGLACDLLKGQRV